MKNKFINSKVFIVILVSILIVGTALVGTYAWFTWSNPSEQNTVFTMSIGDIADVTFENGNNIDGMLSPVYNYYDGLSTNFIVNKISNVNIGYKVYLNITSIDNELISENVKYVLLCDNEIVAEGNLSKTSNGYSITLNYGLLNNKITNFDFYLYLDGNVLNNSNMMNKSISGNILVDANAAENAVEYISNLYNNGVKDETNKDSDLNEYSSVSEHLLFNDRFGATTDDFDAGNIRYYGSTPKNYIDIGDRDSEGNVILYRIVGVFKDIKLEDGTTKDFLKVVRDESIGTYWWNGDSGINDWSKAKLMMLLNPGYEDGAVDSNGNVIYEHEGSLWWNSRSGKCYTNKSVACDFTSTGLSKNVHDKVASVVWNIGGFDTSLRHSASLLYSYERGTDVYEGRPTEWTGKVGLLYLSDFIYSSIADSWFKYVKQWTINPVFSSATAVYKVISYGSNFSYDISPYSAVFGTQVFPTFYLEPELLILMGTGTIDDPYVVE